MSEQEVEQIFLNEVSAKWAGAPTSSERMTEAGLKEREVYLQALTRCTAT
ncbi:hypothetical protein SAMN04515695_0933 [Pseudovibrio sp. Tun.PSC04-5.I4]|nr:hypothetical protein SAMN04515695_0933 [Pseudovibrio sp. Tun.PSC04-5.I4]